VDGIKYGLDLSRAHDPIRQVLLPYRGTKITNRQWDELVKKIPSIGDNAKFIHASDHCSNMNNAGACDCAETARALVRRVRRGKPSLYLVL
jgi:hypothetical protein